jgi:hypothetical protein
VISHLSFSTKGDLRSTGAGQLPPRIVEPEVEEDDGAAEREAEKRAGQESKEARDARRNKNSNKNSAQEWPNASVHLVVAAACASLSPPVSYLFFWGLANLPSNKAAFPSSSPRAPRRRRAHLIVAARTSSASYVEVGSLLP